MTKKEIKMGNLGPRKKFPSHQTRRQVSATARANSEADALSGSLVKACLGVIGILAISLN